MAYSDDIASAPDISGGADATWDNLTATDNTDEPLNLDSSGNNVWQKVFLTDPGTYIFSHDTTPPGDTVMSIYQGPSAATYADLVFVDSGDDEAGHSKPRIGYASAGGEWIYIESTGFDGDRVDGQTTLVSLLPAPHSGWVDLNSFDQYMVGWVADMGVYAGPWPFYWPPQVNPLVPSGSMSFYVALPNPTDPTNPAAVMDGSYPTYIYRAATSGLGTWYDGNCTGNGSGGVTFPVPVDPPAVQPGAHLYVVLDGTDNTVVPEMDPASLVPVSYGGTNPQEWSPGQWSDTESSSTETGPSGSFNDSTFSGYVGNDVTRSGAILERTHVTGYTNDPGWAATTGLTFSLAVPFPTQGLGGEGPNLDTLVGPNVPSTGNAINGSALRVTALRHYYDPGAGLGIKAEDAGPLLGGPGDGPAAQVQLTQHHHAREVGISHNDYPAFFNTGFGTVWGRKPWTFAIWDPLTEPFPSFDDWSAVAYAAAGYAHVQGVPPSDNPPFQIFDFYGRQVSTPVISDNVATGGRIEDSDDYVLLTSVTVTFDWSTGAATFPSTVDLPLSAIPQLSTGRHMAIEVMVQARVLSNGGITVVDTPEIDQTTVPNGGEIYQSAEYDFDCGLNNNTFPWTINWPPFSYWVPGELVPSGAVKWHTVAGSWASISGAPMAIFTPGLGAVDYADGPA